MSSIWGGCMSRNIIEFNSEVEFVAYRKAKTCRELGTGSEGTCYLGKDGLAYKDLTDGFRRDDYIPEDIITRSDSDNKSFAFPHTLFVVRDHLVGYTSTVVTQDITNYKRIFFEGLDHIDFERLYQAYEVMYDDAIKLSKDGIGVYDLSFNLMFDGERLTGVDTCGYYRAPVMECLHNTDAVDTAVKNLFTSYAEYVKGKKLDTSMDVKSFLDTVERKFTNHPPRIGNPYIKQ